MLLVWACSGSVWAIDPDILISEQLRRETVAPSCRILVVQSSVGSPEHTYHKALCVLYGLEVAPQATLALALMREAARAGWVEAQVALADTLQKGTRAEQEEALRWYASAMALGDVRAAGRHARLTQRYQAQVVMPPADASGSEGFGDGMPVNRQGYHCHIAGLGKKYCHSAWD